MHQTAVRQSNTALYSSGQRPTDASIGALGPVGCSAEAVGVSRGAATRRVGEDAVDPSPVRRSHRERPQPRRGDGRPVRRLRHLPRALLQLEHREFQRRGPPSGRRGGQTEPRRRDSRRCRWGRRPRRVGAASLPTGDHHNPLRSYERYLDRVPADYFVFEMKSIADVARCVGADPDALPATGRLATSVDG